jgi:hypothetical protein
MFYTHTHTHTHIYICVCVYTHRERERDRDRDRESAGVRGGWGEREPGHDKVPILVPCCLMAYVQVMERERERERESERESREIERERGDGGCVGHNWRCMCGGTPGQGHNQQASDTDSSCSLA